MSRGGKASQKEKEILKMKMVICTRRERTLLQWNEVLKKAKKRLANSKKCYELFGDDDSKRYVKEDEKAVKEIEEKIKKVIAFMDEHGIN